MTERELELRLAGVAALLDADAPSFDPALLRRADRRRRWRPLVALAAVAAVVAAPAAVSALGDLFRVETVPELGPRPANVTAPFEGRRGSTAEVPFMVQSIERLGAPDVFVRDDIQGGMVSLHYRGGVVLSEWPADALEARTTIVPVQGTAEEVDVGSRRGLWVAGTARGTFVLTGADGAIHREEFEVAGGALLWEKDGIALLLQGVPDRETAADLAATASSG
jgi:hypothetical protein